MPTFKPLGASVRLVAYDLASSTSANPQRAKDRSTDDTKRAEQGLLNGTRLVENHVQCMGDNTRLHYLDNVPFYLISSGEELFAAKKPTLLERVEALIKAREEAIKAQNKDANIRRDTIAGREQSPQPSTSHDNLEASPHVRIPLPRAIGLIITLPKEVFVETFASNKKAPSHGGKKLDIKWDVFFNGELVMSDFQSSRYAAGRDGVSVPSMDNGNVRTVTGKKHDILHERPWVLLPPVDEVGSGDKEAMEATISAEERWKEIGQALLQHADKIGFNRDEERTPLGKYLADMSALELPESLINAQTPNSRKFGVIDVVISAGRGKKGISDNHFIVGPERLPDSNFRKMHEGWDPSARNKVTIDQIPAHGDDQIMSDPDLRAMISTAAFNREKRNTSAPAIRSEASPPMIRLATLEAPSEPSPEKRAPILPPFPMVPELDFNDVIAITPTKAEEARRNRGGHDGSPSPEKLIRPEAAMNMPPPLVIPRSVSHSKRRRSDDVYISSESSSTGKPYVPSTRPGATSGSKSVSGFMGMTRRGVLTNNPNSQLTPTTSPYFAPPSTSLISGGSTPATSPIKRVVFTDGDSPMVDRTLLSPRKLREEASATLQHPQSPHQPLDESFLFGPRATRGAAKPVKPTPLVGSSPFAPMLTSTPNLAFQVPSLPPQPPTPVPAAPDMSPLRITTPAPQTSPTPATGTIHVSPTRLSTRPSSTARTVASRATGTPATQLRLNRQHADIITEAKAKWVMPELSKNCVLTYAEDGDWFKEQGSIVRHVKSARAGTFQENEVLFAVRYIVPG